MNATDRFGSATGEPPAAGHFAIGADRRIEDWDEAAQRLLGIPGSAALGRPCHEVIAGRSDFGRAVCGPSCPAWKSLGAGEVAGAAQVLVRGADGARLRLDCDLVALPGGGALGRLRSAGHAAPDHSHDLAAIAALTTRASGQPLQQGLRVALGFLMHATAADAGEAFLAEPHGTGMVRTCHRGCFARAFDQLQRFDPGNGFPGLVLANGEAVYTDRLPQDPRFLRTSVKREGFGACVCAPLTSHGDTLGCLALSFRRCDIDLERVLSLLRWVGTPMGLVIDTALTHLRAAADVCLHDVADGPQHRLPQALRGVLQEMVRVGRADAGELFVPWQEQPLRALVPDPGAAPRCPMLGADTIGRCPAFQAGRPIIVHGHRSGWPEACQSATHPGGAWCCIPMSCDGESIGTIRLLYRRLRPTPPNENIALIEGLATLTAEKLRDLRERLAPARDSGAVSEVRREHGTDEAAGCAAVRPARRAEPGERRRQVHLEIRCFGSLELSIDGARVAPTAIRRKRVTTLLGILLTNHDQPQCKDALIELLWPGADPEVRTRQFHVLVHELRRLVESRSRGGNWRYVRNQTDRYTFDTRSSCWIDTLEFHALIERGRKAQAAHEVQAAIDAHEAAVDLYRGDYLQDEPFAEWCWQAREQLREACLGALDRLATLWGGQERWDRSIACARRALELDPLREQMHRALMYALWASGRRDEAARQYEACAHLLRQRLDLAPLPETEQLFARIRAHARPRPGTDTAPR